MKKFQFTVLTIATLFLVAPIASIAEPTHPNEIGLYTTPDGYGDTGTDDIGIPVNVYLVLTKPQVGNEPCLGLTAFDCQLNFNPTGGIFMTGNALNGVGFNIGDVAHIDQGYLEFIVGFADLVPTVDDAILMVSFQFIYVNPVPIEVTMGPCSVPAIPGEMVFLPGDPPYELMHSMGGSPDAPVFIFGGEAIAVEPESFGSVKALFR